MNDRQWSKQQSDISGSTSQQKGAATKLPYTNFQMVSSQQLITDIPVAGIAQLI